MTKLKIGKQKRDLGLESLATMGEGENKSFEFAFSSETPVERWYGTEILSHDEGAADFSRLNDGAPVLFNHDPSRVVGVVERAWIENKRGMVRVKMSRNESALELVQDVEDGIIRNVSFGYQVQEVVEKRSESGPSEYLVTRFLPLEVSFVAIPADASVGMSRSEDSDGAVEIEVKSEITKETEIAGETSALEGEEVTVESKPVDVKAIEDQARANERARIASISALGERFKQADLARTLIEGGRSLDDARAAFLEKMDAPKAPVAEAGVDMSAKEQKAYSLVRAINASISKDWSKAGLEAEVSREIARRTGKETAGFFMPMNVETRATYAVGAAATGGNVVATDLLAAQFIDILRNKAMVVQMGARMLSGLVGNVAIPRQNLATAAAWVTEGNAPAQAEATFDQVTMTPKQIAARSQMTRLMLQQSTPDIEQIVRNDLAAQLALAIDLAAINGSGASGQPRGVLQTSGIGSVAMGTNGAAITIDALIDLEERVATANADMGSLGYMTTPRAVAALKKLKSTGGEYLWSQANTASAVSGASGAINGYPVGKSNQVPSNLTKGSGTNLHAVIFGDFSQLLIGEWGVLEILPNPYGAGYNAGSVDIRAMQTVDVAVRQPAGFAAIVDAIV